MKKLLVTFMVALFATVVLGQSTQTEIRPTDLQDCVQKYIKQNYAGWNIDKAVKIESKLVLTYEVSLVKEKERMVVTFNDKCKLIKKIKPEPKHVNPDGTAPAPKPKVEPKKHPLPPQPTPTSPATPAKQEDKAAPGKK